MNFYEPGSIVWVQLTNRWWPGRVKSLDECPVQYLSDLKKEPLAIVNFFNESGLHHVTKQEQIFSYNCNKKMDFIRKGLSAVKSSDLRKKFEEDVVMSEKLTGGNMDIIKELKVESQKTNKRRIDYSDLGFGEPKVKKASKDESHQIHGFTNIGEAILYKKGKKTIDEKPRIEHVVKILEQKQKTDEMTSTSTTNWFKCNRCGFTCCRLNVIIWHNKAHMKKVMDYDSGIKVPGRRKRRAYPQGRKETKQKLVNHRQVAVDHSKVNGHVSPKTSSQEAKQLLLDWDEDDVEDEESSEVQNGAREANGIEEDDDDNNNLDDDEDYDDYPPSQPRRDRQPMPKQVDINSAFDALLADSSLNTGSNVNHNSSTYVNNDSDSDNSDWEKYYNKGSDSEDDKDQESDSPNSQNGHDSPKKRKSLRDSRSSKAKSPDFSKSRRTNLSGRSISLASKSKSSDTKEESNSPAITTEPSEDHSNQSSSNSSTSSGPAYMLVAVDAQGNNVPMPVLSEGGNHLVAVEASMEDGTTRTLYIDPAHLGPNVDLNNLMLHIDNSGQETVIIPTSSADGEIISSTLVDQASHDTTSSQSNVNEDGSSKSTNKHIECSTSKRQGNQPLEDSKSEGTDDSSKPIEFKLNKIKKKDENTEQSELKQSKCGLDTNTETSLFDPSFDIDDDDSELPDLDSNDTTEYHKLFSPNDLVWAMTHGHWWPSFILKIHVKEGKASILYINCQQSVPIKVNLKRLKAFTHNEYADIFENQKDKAVGLTEAMEMAHQYKSLKEEKNLKQAPKEFFSLSYLERISLVNRLNLTNRSAPVGEKSQEEKDPSDILVPSETDNSPEGELSLRQQRTPEQQAEIERRRLANEPYVNYIKSDSCLDHLRSIFNTGTFYSQRHQDFKPLCHQLIYYAEMNRLHNPGVDFFGEEDTMQTEEVISFLISKFLESELSFLDDKPKRMKYIHLVLFPEAIKQSLRTLTEIPEERLEEVLSTGIVYSKSEN